MTGFQFKNILPLTLSAVEIVGERVRLVPITNKYETDIFHEFTAAVTRYMFPKPPETIDDTRAFIRRSHKTMQAGNNLQLVILQRETGEFLGCCGLHGKDNGHKPELGLWLKTGAHGHRYGREAITVLVDWAKTHLEVDGFIYPVDLHNLPAARYLNRWADRLCAKPKSWPNRDRCWTRSFTRFPLSAGRQPCPHHRHPQNPRLVRQPAAQSPLHLSFEGIC